MRHRFSKIASQASFLVPDQFWYEIAFWAFQWYFRACQNSRSNISSTHVPPFGKKPNQLVSSGAWVRSTCVYATIIIKRITEQNDHNITLWIYKQKRRFYAAFKQPAWGNKRYKWLAVMYDCIDTRFFWKIYVIDDDSK